MHAFGELVAHSTAFTLGALNSAFEELAEELENSGATTLVKGVQMVQLQKAIFACGMLSMFDSILQDKLECQNGFQEAGDFLESAGQLELKERFRDLQLAVNVLKHGNGTSYNALIQKASSLPFRVKLPNEGFFNEGDVAEVSTLIEVDDRFVKMCATIIQEVSDVIEANTRGA